MNGGVPANQKLWPKAKPSPSGSYLTIPRDGEFCASWALGEVESMTVWKDWRHSSLRQLRTTRRWSSALAALALIVVGTTTAILHSGSAYAATDPITFDGSPGTNAPPPKLGAYTM